MVWVIGTTDVLKKFRANILTKVKAGLNISYNNA